MLLTNQFNRSENTSAAYKLAALQTNTAKRVVPVSPSTMLWPTFALNFTSNVLYDLSQAYMTVFVLAAVPAGSIISPAVFLSKELVC
ncbi:hypothetical protein [Mycobacterium leprae]|nr:hypothetical protein [Mycobacterium leprae]